MGKKIISKSERANNNVKRNKTENNGVAYDGFSAVILSLCYRFRCYGPGYGADQRFGIQYKPEYRRDDNRKGKHRQLQNDVSAHIRNAVVRIVRYVVL
jgi:hypothetical protein